MQSLKMSPKIAFKTNRKKLVFDCHKSTTKLEGAAVIPEGMSIILVVLVDIVLIHGTVYRVTRTATMAV